ncbi:MAG: bifunctional ornithine acetyltransferase/N-acetylglutamate synthase [Firmicutes bacterium]|nr:bifunctional ornithine acetyltransferase/N-acetylglutamate synthase [Bacillota bacterium]
MKIIKDKPISVVPGFKTMGIHCGVKKRKKDLCLIYSQSPAVSAATFTKNKSMAAPVMVSQKHIKNENTQAIIINSGNANACTGTKGYEDALKMTETVANNLNLKKEEVMVASTGIIGVNLPINNIVSGIDKCCNLIDNNDGESSAQAILTTDSFTKTITVKLEIDNKPIFISAIAKGSGMIHPNMGTMLSFITTNLNIEKDILNDMLKLSIEDSYNMVSVDGDTSTNDTVIMLANKMANNKVISKKSEDYYKFKKALDYVNKYLAKMIAKDGEGSTKLIEVNLENAKSLKDAKLCAKSVVSSNLVKTAMFGNDPNWGRILCSLGYSGGDFSQEKVDISIGCENSLLDLVKNGISLDFDKTSAEKILKNKHIIIKINLNDGKYKATAWGCDLTYDYIKCNGVYTT